MEEPTLDEKYDSLQTGVCMTTRNNRYKKLTTAMEKDNDTKIAKTTKLVNMTESFLNSLKEEQNRTGTYCGERKCQRLPYSRFWFKEVPSDREFIPTTYHILQEYGLLFLKAKMNFEKIKVMNKKTISQWTVLAHSGIVHQGNTIRNSDERIQYYEDCIDMVNKIIYLRNYDADICLINSTDTKKRSDHEGFTNELKTLITLIETNIIQDRANVTFSTR